MSEIGGDRPSVDAVIHELVPTGMPQDMRMDAAKADSLGGAPQHLEEAARAHRRFALGHEDERSWLVLAHAAQRSDLDAAERMPAAPHCLSGDGCGYGRSLDRSDPSAASRLADAQAVPIGQEDHGRVPMPVPSPSPRCRCEPLNFVGRQIRSDWRGHPGEIHHCPGFSGLFSVGGSAVSAEMLISSPPTVQKIVISGTVIEGI